ncbi:MAG: signal peptidase II [Patescibacteria group bacterium]|nr:signal peptidase II [Patescibacteria group bacterium]
MKGAKKIILILLIPTIFFALESFIKYYLILNKIPQSGFYFFNGLLQIGFFTNLNLAFGLPLPQSVIMVFIFLILIVLGYLWWRDLILGNLWQVFSVSLIILGALSNFIDRLIFGFVIDYINVFIWPVFNLADAMIVVGVIIFFVEGFKTNRESIFLDQNKINSAYRLNKCLWGNVPNEYVVKIPGYIKKGRVLDVGCGEGRNAIFLAEEGFEVTGIDISEEAIVRLQNSAHERNLQIKTFTVDANNFEFNENYDVIISTAVLHLIKREDLSKLILKIQSHTAINGINLISVFTTKDYAFKKNRQLHFFEPEELKNFYKGWRILEYKNYIKQDYHGKPHKHDIIILVAQKIG